MLRWLCLHSQHKRTGERLREPPKDGVEGAATFGTGCLGERDRDLEDEVGAERVQYK